jgi:hypothetical protein
LIQAYAALKLAESNKARLTPEFLEYSKHAALSNNTKIFFGPDIPAYFNAMGGVAGV